MHLFLNCAFLHSILNWVDDFISISFNSILFLSSFILFFILLAFNRDSQFTHHYKTSYEKKNDNDRSKASILSIFVEVSFEITIAVAATHFVFLIYFSKDVLDNFHKRIVVFFSFGLSAVCLFYSSIVQNQITNSFLVPLVQFFKWLNKVRFSLMTCDEKWNSEYIKFSEKLNIK